MGLLRKRGYKGTTFMDSLAITEFRLLIFNITFFGELSEFYTEKNSWQICSQYDSLLMVPVLWFMVSVLQIYTSWNQKLKSTHKSCFLHKMLGLYVFSVVSSVYLYRPHILPSIHPWKMYHCYWTQSHSSLYSSLFIFLRWDCFQTWILSIWNGILVIMSGWQIGRLKMIFVFCMCS